MGEWNRLFSLRGKHWITASIGMKAEQLHNGISAASEKRHSPRARLDATTNQGAYSQDGADSSGAGLAMMSNPFDAFVEEHQADRTESFSPSVKSYKATRRQLTGVHAGNRMNTGLPAK